MTAPLPRYLTAAFLARLADEGVGVTIALLALAHTGSPALGALVLTAFTAPHLLAGPLAGALAARTRSPRLLHTGALTGFAAALAALPALVGRAPVWAVVAVSAAGGCCGPMVTGGLSSLVAELTTRNEHRAYAWDAATYNAASVTGPALAAGAAHLWSPGTATVVLAAGALAAAALVATLPHRAEPGPRPAGTALTAGLRALWRVPELRAITAATTASFVGIGGLTLTTVLFAAHLGDAGGAGPLLTAFALGALTGSVLLTRLPTSPPPLRLARLCLAALGVALILTALAPTYWASLAGFALAGLADGPLLGATLRLRADHAPPGTRAQVFTLGAALKISAASLGAALVGLTGGLPAPALLAGIGVIVLASAALTRLGDARRRGTTAPPPELSSP
ncbi:MFS transporter [Phytomonospora endophytica]|uniref:MFS family permease n=1 Tax=Phytomonospora endophytica TaxID=714109 RepID=A0A841FS95_9ACTN|nr:MFS transporter [Phytomonospora endophytica]MBB6034840.1 MFS family permease [Phytomonospora endophytica]